MDKDINLYQGIFAEVYHLYWREYVDIIAPQLIEFIETKFGPSQRILDLCCGTGRLSHELLKKGHIVHGIDIAPDMIKVANKTNHEFVINESAKFYVDDAVSFTTNETYQLVSSTFDALNHLQDYNELESVFNHVYDVLDADGVFIFDLNTEKGLKDWDFVDVEDNEETVFIMHGGVDRKQKTAYTRVYGFHRVDENYWEKIDQIFSNHIFELQRVENLLQKAGFDEVIFYDSDDLSIELDKPEEQNRVLIMARKLSTKS